MFIAKRENPILMLFLVVIVYIAIITRNLFMVLVPLTLIIILYRYFKGDREKVINTFLIKKKIVKVFILFLIAINLSIYTFQRFEVMNKNSAYHLAKEYYIVGNILFSFRKALITIVGIPPERKLIRPLENLQRAIFNSGVKHLPKDDGEWGIWLYHYFIYPYSITMHLPYYIDTKKDKITPYFKQIVDDSYKALKFIATKPIKDKNFNEKKYLIYPVFAMYYEHASILYFIPSKYNPWIYTKYFEDLNHVKKFKWVLHWALKLEKEWIKNSKAYSYIKNHPKLELAQINAVINITKLILYHQMYHEKFRCDSYYVKIYYKYVYRFNGNNSPKYRVKKRVKESYESIINDYGTIISTIGHRLCGYKRLEGDDFVWYYGDGKLLYSNAKLGIKNSKIKASFIKYER